jgi:hypothetical protein
MAVPSAPADQAARGSRLAALLGHGALELRSVDDAPPAASPYRSVSGARVAIGVAPGWRRRVSSWCLFDTPDGPRGFQQAPRGTSLFALLPQSHLVRLDRYVSLAGGVLAHYHLDWGPESVSGFTVWQGMHSDVFTYDFTAFDPALATFAGCGPQDAPRGARLTPPLSWNLREEEVTVETGPADNPVLISAAHRSRANPPVWAGTLGRGAQFYRLETGGQRILAVTDSAVAEIDTVAADTLLSGEHLVGLAEHLSLEWTPR